MNSFRRRGQGYHNSLWQCRNKASFVSEEAAKKAQEQLPHLKKHTYPKKCSTCGQWHLESRKQS